MTDPGARSWLRPPPARPAGSPAPLLTLVAVPHAGAGAASFARWPALFGPSVRTLRVQLPGREDVTDEAPRRRCTDVVAALGPQVARLAVAGGPVALYGHSTGAVVAFELARALSAAGVPPVHLAVSGRRAPHLPARGAPVHRLPDEEFLAALDAMAAVPGRPSGPARTAARRRYELRVVRADLELGEEYRPDIGPPLDVPVLALAGRDDPIVDAADVLAWGARTRAAFAVDLLPGGHFFHQEHRVRVAALLRAAWADLVPGLEAVPGPPVGGTTTPREAMTRAGRSA